MNLPPTPPRIEKLRIRNYRTLRDVTIALEPFTVFVGANGSGKSTILDVFSFLSECFSESLPKAWDKRGGLHELRSRGAAENEKISFELKYREAKHAPLTTYHLEISEQKGRPVISHEYLQCRRGPKGKAFKFLEFKQGRGGVANGNDSDATAEKKTSDLAAPDLLAVNALGQFQDHPHIQALRKFITGWQLFHLSSEDIQHGQRHAHSQEHLSQTGGNIANVVQFLQEKHPEILQDILHILQRRVPHLEKFEPWMVNGRLSLRFKDQPFDDPVQAHFVSDGTLKMLAYLILLLDPNAPPLIGIEEPENFLHPKLMSSLASDCESAVGQSQFLTTTHSPAFLNAVDPSRVRFLARDQNGYTQIRTTKEVENLHYFIKGDFKVGNLWMEDYIKYGDPDRWAVIDRV